MSKSIRFRTQEGSQDLWIPCPMKGYEVRLATCINCEYKVAVEIGAIRCRFEEAMEFNKRLLWERKNAVDKH